VTPISEPVSDVNGRGLLADRPAALIRGRLYFPTDVDGVAYWDTGTAWDTISLGAASLALDDLSDVDTTSTPPTDQQALIWDDGLSLWVPGDVAAGGAGGRLPVAATLGADVGLSTSYTDVLSLSLGAGTWVVVASLNCHASSSTPEIVAKIWDGSTVYGSGELTISLYDLQLAVVSRVITLTATTTIKVSARDNTGTGSILAQAHIGTPGNNSSNLVAIPSGSAGGGVDYDVSPNPTAYDDEFKTLTGWTTLGTLDSGTPEVTTRGSHLYLKRTTAATDEADGIYKACPAVPFTVTAKIAEVLPNISSGVQLVGLLLTEASPGKLFTTSFSSNTGYGYWNDLLTAQWTNRTSRGTSVDHNVQYALQTPFRYLRWDVTSTTCTVWTSYDGFIWQQAVAATAHNLTPANIGLFIGGANSSGQDVRAMFDWIRFGSAVVQPDAILWQNVGGATDDVVKTKVGGGTIYVPRLRGDADRLPAAPSSYDDEFEAYSGWTQLGTLDTVNATDFPSHLHLVRNSVDSAAIDAIYKAAPATPFTVTTLLADMLFEQQYNFAGLVIGDGAPGKMMTAGVWYVGGAPYCNPSVWTNRTTRSANTDVANTYIWTAPVYLRMVVNSITSVHFDTSKDGKVWRRAASAYNPGLSGSVAVVGLFQGGWTAGIKAESVFDWIRFT